MAHADRLEDIKKSGVLRVASFDSNPPFGFVDAKSKQIEGLDVDYAKAIADKLGVKLQLQPTNPANPVPLGMRPVQVMRLIILPQALPIMLPSFLNQWISLIKDTSLAYVIGVGELSFVATQVSNRVMVHPTEIFLFVALVYFVFCSCLDLLTNFATSKQAVKR